MKSMLAATVVCGMLFAPAALAATPTHAGIGGGGTGLPPTASTYVPSSVPATSEQATSHLSGSSAPASSTQPTLPTTTPSPPGKPSVLPQPRCASGAAHAKQVTYVLRGTLSAYAAATAKKAGSVTIAVTGGNCFTRALAGTKVKFTLDQSTRIVHGDSISDGDRGMIQLRGPKTTDTTTLATLTPRLVIDQNNTQQSD